MQRNKYTEAFPFRKLQVQCSVLAPFFTKSLSAGQCLALHTKPPVVKQLHLLYSFLSTSPSFQIIFISTVSASHAFLKIIRSFSFHKIQTPQFGIDLAPSCLSIIILYFFTQSFLFNQTGATIHTVGYSMPGLFSYSYHPPQVLPFVSLPTSIYIVNIFNNVDEMDNSLRKI